MLQGGHAPDRPSRAPALLLAPRDPRRPRLQASPRRRSGLRRRDRHGSRAPHPSTRLTSEGGWLTLVAPPLARSRGVNAVGTDPAAPHRPGGVRDSGKGRARFISSCCPDYGHRRLQGRYRGRPGRGERRSPLRYPRSPQIAPASPTSSPSAGSAPTRHRARRRRLAVRARDPESPSRYGFRRPHVVPRRSPPRPRRRTLRAHAASAGDRGALRPRAPRRRRSRRGS